MSADTKPAEKPDELISRNDVLALINGLAFPPGVKITEAIDGLYTEVEALELRPLPDGGRRITVELFGVHATDLLWVEATRHLSTTEAVRWLVRAGANEALRMEQTARQMARVLAVPVVEARDYVNAEHARGTQRLREQLGPDVF
jgi:hypothetical protein